MTWRRSVVLLMLLTAVGCSRKRADLGPAPVRAAPTLSSDSLWALAQREFDQGRYGVAQRHLDALAPMVTSSDPRYLRMHFFLGEILFAEGSQLQAVREFRRIADERPDSPLAPDALLRAADAYADLWRRPELDPTYGETARGVYQEVISRFDGTTAAARAAVRLRELGERFAEKEYKAADFYFRFKAYDSAILMFRSVIATYPNSRVVPDALERLVRSYQTLGYEEDVKETCAYIAQYHPDPAGPRRLCPVAAPAGSAGPP